ncbi:MAG: rhodanese-like domain-containing protein [Gammaproteobacteria bacterium]|nr:rhodanese-like domain-containing protein [Gammaproteobacteria bacterium]
MDQLLDFILRHPLLVSATFVAVAALIANELRLRSQGGVTVPAHEAVRLINQGATVVDVREAARFDAGHIIDAINVPAAELAGQAAERLKKKRAVLVVCDHGGSSARLVPALRKAGFEKAWSLAGGLAAWERERLPVVAGKGRG